MSKKNRGVQSRKHAVSSREAIDAKDIVEQLTRERQEEDRPVYTLHDEQISGKLDLRHCIVNFAVDIQRCEFLDEVDLRYCEFTQAVDFSACTFRKDFNSGDAIESHTTYRKDLICNRAIFEGAMDFNGGRVESSAYFSKASFNDEKQSADFAWTTIEETLECDKATFKGPANFGTLKCRSLSCQEATFEGSANFSGLECSCDGFFSEAYFLFEGTEGVDLTGASFGGNLDCTWTTFKGPVGFGSLKCNNLVCNKATFEGSAVFNSLECDGNGFFNRANFLFEDKEGVSFGYASFGGSLHCNEATFKGPANFHALKCGSIGFFRKADFLFQGEEGVEFSYASFGVNLECNEATFKGPTRFHALKCGNGGFFKDAIFLFEGGEGVEFGYASFGGSLHCNEATFKGPANFGSVEFGVAGFFPNANFRSEEKINFRNMYTGVNLQLDNTHFAGEVDLGMARISRKLVLAGNAGVATFDKEVCFEDASINILELSSDKSSAVSTKSSNGLFPFRETVELRGCEIKTFLDPKGQATELVRRQNPAKFSRDPYLQLEEYYRSAGNEAEAKKVHYLGRCHARENATKYKKRGTTKWSRPTRWGDWWLKLLTGYGVYTWRIVGLIVFFLIAGAVVFWSDGALEVQPFEASKAAGAGEDASALESRRTDRLVYSLDLFIPVIDWHTMEKWEPNGQWHGIPWRDIYAVVHVVAGWLLIPLFLASWSGVVRRR